MRRWTFEERHLGTPIVLQMICEEEATVRALASLAFEECARIEKTYSRFLDDNMLSALNAHVGEWTEVEEELYRLLEFGARLKEKTQGAFDLSVKALLEEWGYDKNYRFVEEDSGEASALGSIELDSLDDSDTFRVRLSAPIELGGLGKGYAIDRMVNILYGECGEAGAVRGFCINAGGDLFVQGGDENGEPWKIVFEHPQDINLGIGEVKLYGPLALASSSPSRRHWKNGEKLRHHLVDPRTGEPADQMLSVYVQAPAGLLADAYSTALFVLGFDRAQELLPSFPVEAMLISPRGEIWKSAGFKGELYRE